MPRTILRYAGSEVGPDLMVRSFVPSGARWEEAPVPRLAVEAVTPYTRRRAREQRRRFYEDAGAAGYWILDLDGRSITVVRRGELDFCSARGDALAAGGCGSGADVCGVGAVWWGVGGVGGGE